MTPQLSLKSLFIYAPAFGAMLAVAFDVGFFESQDPYYFSFFSLPEHIVFSLSVFPMALLSSYMLLMFAEPISRFLNPNSSSKSTSSKWLIVILSVLAATSLYLYVIGLIIFSVALGSVALAIHSSRDNEIKNRVRYVGALLLAVSGAYAFGALGGHGYLRSGEAWHILELKNAAVLEGRLIRGGERGILFFQNDTQKLQFRKWDEVLRIESQPSYVRRPAPWRR
jgi:hypothetical protein